MIRKQKYPNWKELPRGEFRTMFHCDRHLRVGVGTKALPTLTRTRKLCVIYNSEVDSLFPFDDPVPPTQGYTLNENGAPPYYADLSPDKGRSLFASRDIMKGELVDGVEGGCDVLEWAYTQQFVKGGPSVVIFGGDISSLMNSGCQCHAKRQQVIQFALCYSRN